MTKILEIKDKVLLDKLSQEILAKSPEFIALDTEFIREKTYWPKLCLIQMAYQEEVVLIDPLASEMVLDSFFEVLKNPKIVKVFHSARQDMEIFDHLMGELPSPIFDSQVAAMVCGFKESVSYETLVANLLEKRLDKSSQYTNWALRPLTKNQWKYAIDDVVYLKELYVRLNQQLKERKRASWIEEEMKILETPETYRVNPLEAWKKLRPRRKDPRSLARLQAIAALREQEAQKLDLPRGWLLRDEVILEIVSAPIQGLEDVKKLRGGQTISPSLGKKIIEALKAANAVPEAFCPLVEPTLKSSSVNPILIDLLRLLLKHQCDVHEVAERIIATTPELENLAHYKDKAPVRALNGWRFKVFGEKALDLLNGKLNLKIQKNRLEFF